MTIKLCRQSSPSYSFWKREDRLERFPVDQHFVFYPFLVDCQFFVRSRSTDLRLFPIYGPHDATLLGDQGVAREFLQTKSCAIVADVEKRPKIYQNSWEARGDIFISIQAIRKTVEKNTNPACLPPNQGNKIVSFS